LPVIKQTFNVQRKSKTEKIDFVLLKATCFLLIFILAGLILIYNDTKLNEISQNSTIVYLHQTLNENLIVQSRNFIFNALKSNDIFSSELKVFTYFNTKLPLFLELILVLSCLVVSISKKCEIGYFSNIVILLLDLILIVQNYNLSFNIMVEQKINADFINIGSSVLFLIPIIQLIIIYKLISFIFKSKNQVIKEKNSVLKNELLKNNNNQSTISQKTENVNLNYDSITPKTYTLMKYIQSNPSVSSSNPNLNRNKYSKSTTSCFMQPARFFPSEMSNFTFNRNEKKPYFKNSIDDSMGI
jgi:hypothetical protein